MKKIFIMGILSVLVFAFSGCSVQKISVEVINESGFYLEIVNITTNEALGNVESHSGASNTFSINKDDCLRADAYSGVDIVDSIERCFEGNTVWTLEAP
ncbi:MAG: hypothetical protein ACLFP1_08135 [Candidatus Goldiibacteriota bacterium]